MTAAVDKNWILSFDELRVLLYSLGFTSCNGIFMPSKQFTPDEILAAMGKMSRNEWIINEGDHFEIVPDLKKYLQVIGNPKSTELLEDTDTGRKLFCYIDEEEIAVTEMFLRKRNTIRLRGFDRTSFLEFRKENDL